MVWRGRIVMNSELNAYENMRTKSITASVTDVRECEEEGIIKRYIHCEYWENEKLYIFQSVATPYCLQLSVGDSIQVKVEPDNYKNYYVSINNYIMYNQIEQNLYSKEKYKKMYSRTVRGHIRYEEFYSEEEQEKVSLVKFLFGLVIVGGVYLISKDNINPLIGLGIIIVGGIAEYKMEVKIVGKERTSIKIENAYIADELCWWYEHRKIIYIGLFLLHIYCLYTFLFKWYDYDYVGPTLLTLGVDIVFVYFKIRGYMRKK